MIEQEIIKIFGNRLRLRVCGVCIDEGKILLIKHQNMGQGGYLWSPPGGGLEFGESVEECLKREFLEETGLKISVKRFLFVNEFLQTPLHAIELFFEVEWLSGSLRMGGDPELSEQKQIIEEIAFLGDEDMSSIPSICLHKVMRQINTCTDLLMLSGFLK